MEPKTLLEAVRHFSDPDVCHASGERWAAVPDWPIYEVSTLGRIRRSGTAKLTEAQVREIKARLAAGEAQWPLSREYGVSRSIIQAIKAGKVWQHAA